MGYNRPPERELNEPHHQELSFQLKAKLDILELTAKHYAHGTVNLCELQEAAVAYAQALERKADENIRARRKT